MTKTKHVPVRPCVYNFGHSAATGIYCSAPYTITYVLDGLSVSRKELLAALDERGLEKEKQNILTTERVWQEQWNIE